MSARQIHKLTSDQAAACEALARGEYVVDGEAWVTPIDGHYLVQSKMGKAGEKHDTKSWSKPESAIGDLLERRP